MKRKQIILIFTIISKKMLTSSRYVKFKTIFAPSVSKDLINTLCSIIYHILFSKHIPIRKHWRQTHLCWKRQKFAHIFDVYTRIISNIATQDIKIAIACFSCREMSASWIYWFYLNMQSHVLGNRNMQNLDFFTQFSFSIML
jgi:hypothetical protein